MGQAVALLLTCKAAPDVTITKIKQLQPKHISPPRLLSEPTLQLLASVATFTVEPAVRTKAQCSRRCHKSDHRISSWMNILSWDLQAEANAADSTRLIVLQETSLMIGRDAVCQVG